MTGIQSQPAAAVLALSLLRAAGMTPQELPDRTMAHALAVYRLTKPLMTAPSSRHVAHQLFRAATSVAANYRSVCLGRSPREFVAKLGLVREEADEVVFWLEFARQSGITGRSETAELVSEACELAAIMSAAYRTSKSRLAESELSNNK